MQLGKLTTQHSEQLVSERCYGHAENNHKYFRYMLDNDFPSAALFNQDGRAIAYVLYKPEGCLGAAYVHPDYRGRGLFKIVCIELLKILKEQKYFCHIYADTMICNTASNRALMGIGGKRYDNFIAHWISFKPKIKE